MNPAVDLILANRSYVDHNSPPGAPNVAGSGDGGLLAAMRPLIAPWDGQHGTTWIGIGRGRHDGEWVDLDGYELVETPRGPLRHRRLVVDEATWRDHYAAASNGFFWPLLHLVRQPLHLMTSYYPRPRTPSSAEWDAYRRVNRGFAEAAARERDASTLWVHDYQLALVPGMLRAAGDRRPLGFFLHTPFPAPATWRSTLDEAGTACLAEFVRGVLGADLVGLQTDGDVERFAETATELAGAGRTSGGLTVAGREVRVGAYPVGIDCDEVITLARTAALPAAAEAIAGKRDPLVVGLERCDFTKGIPERLTAIANAYAAGERFSYIGIAAPTREGVSAYGRVAHAVERAAAAAAKAAEATGCTFIQLREAIPWEGVVALQRDAAVVFTSSLADGMNLVPLQAVAAQSLKAEPERGVILVGRDAGFARTYADYEGQGFVTVDPLNMEAMRAALSAALRGDPARISAALIAAVRAHDARRWAAAFLGDLREAAC